MFVFAERSLRYLDIHKGVLRGICVFPRVYWGGPPVNPYFYSDLPKNLNLHKIIFPPLSLVFRFQNLPEEHIRFSFSKSPRGTKRNFVSKIPSCRANFILKTLYKFHFENSQPHHIIFASRFCFAKRIFIFLLDSSQEKML